MYVDRREEILKELGNQSSMTVKSLSEQLSVSEMTIRRDLDKMEKEGIVKRCFGGVSLMQGLLMEQSLPVRAANMPEAKRKMAAIAAEMIHDGDSVLLDSGTTIQELAKLLSHKKISIATSSLLIAKSAADGEAEVHVSGGILNSAFQTLSGRTAERFYENINCQYAFISAGGISLKRGITEYTESGAALKQMMIEHSKVGILMIDSTKWNTIQMFRASRLADVDIVITDQKPPKEYIQFFQENGIELIIAES